MKRQSGLLALLATAVVGVTGCSSGSSPAQPPRPVGQSNPVGAALTLDSDTIYGWGDTGSARVDVRAHEFPANMTDPAIRENLVVPGNVCSDMTPPGNRTDNAATLAWLESASDKAMPKGSEATPWSTYTCLDDDSALLLLASGAKFGVGGIRTMDDHEAGTEQLRAVLTHPVVDAAPGEFGPVVGIRTLNVGLGSDDDGLAPSIGSHTDAGQTFVGIIGDNCAALGRRGDGTWVGVGADDVGYNYRRLADNAGLDPASIERGAHQGSVRPSAEARGMCEVASSRTQSMGRGLTQSYALPVAVVQRRSAPVSARR